MGSRAGLDDIQRRKIFQLPGLELRTHSCSARNQSLHRLRYPGSFFVRNVGKLLPDCVSSYPKMAIFFTLIVVRTPDLTFCISFYEVYMLERCNLAKNTTV
jgi:hypothetical protein